MKSRRGSLPILLPLVLRALAATAAAAPPVELPVLSVDHGALAWSAVDEAVGYDLIWGDLPILRQTGGDFRAATSACLADDLVATSLTYAAVPPPGSGYWFLVRAVGASESGTYDSGGTAQAASRDSAIEASPYACFAPVVPHSLIRILNDSGFTAANGVVGGAGTAADPYRISGWSIYCPPGTEVTGIGIEGTTLPFLIRNVVIEHCDTGVRLGAAHGGRIERARIADGMRGVHVVSGAAHEVEGVFIDAETVAGLEVENAAEVLVRGSTLSDSAFGVRLTGASLSAVHHNNLLNNTSQAFDDSGGANAWDDGYPGGGNFWADYSGADQCGGPGQDLCNGGDGFGDTPYAVASGTTDRYPRIAFASVVGDTIPPVLTIASPSNGASIFVSQVPVLLLTSDAGVGVRNVEVRNNGGPWIPAVGPESAPGGQSSWSVAVDVIAGVNRIEARASDYGGNSAAPVSVQITAAAPASSWATTTTTDRASYPQTEPVTIHFNARNITPGALLLHLTTSCLTSFKVSALDGSAIFDQRAHLSCPGYLTTVQVQPDATISYEMTWIQKDDQGEFVLPGSYRIRADIDSLEDVAAAETVITVEP